MNKLYGIATALAGLSQSTIFPCMILWTSCYIPMTTAVGAVLIAGTSIGAAICGPLAGYMFQEYSHMWIIYLGLISSILSIILYIVMHVYVKCFHNTENSDINKTINSELQPMKCNEKVND